MSSLPGGRGRPCARCPLTRAEKSSSQQEVVRTDPGGRSPSRGHGGALTRSAQHSGTSGTAQPGQRSTSGFRGRQPGSRSGKQAENRETPLGGDEDLAVDDERNAEFRGAVERIARPRLVAGIQLRAEI